MKVNNSNQVFNLFDINGHRKDTINDYKIYTNILSQFYEESESVVWGRYTNESIQFMFYELGIQNSPEIL